MSAVPKVKALECPSCGGTVELRGHAHTLNAVCVQCLSILDTQTPELKILQQFSAAQRYMPAIPLGTRGRFGNVEYEAIGFQVRQIVVEEVAYRWSEYLLYNPYRGYLYLTEYQGHWNVIRTLNALPKPSSSGGRSAVWYAGKTYKHFQTATATTVYVMGEFPWQVRAGDEVLTADFVSPPEVLSSETTAGETVWSQGQYVQGRDIWAAFSLKGNPPPAQGVYANQPNPIAGRVASAWGMFAVFAVLFVITVGIIAAFTGEKEVFRQRYAFSNAAPGEHSFVTPVFEVGGREGLVNVYINTDLNNDWAYFSLALINDNTGAAYDFGKEVSYYSGRDSDGSWSEGGMRADISVPSVPPGRYYLRVEPDMEEGGVHTVNYDLIVTRGGVTWLWPLLIFFLLPLPAIWVTLRHSSFEGKRWTESDYGSQWGTASE